MITQDQMDQVSARLEESQQIRRMEEEDYDLALIRQVNRNRANKQQVSVNGYDPKAEDVFVRVVGNRPCKVTVSKPRQYPKKRIPFWWGFIAGAITTGVVVILVESVVRLLVL